MKASLALASCCLLLALCLAAVPACSSNDGAGLDAQVESSDAAQALDASSLPDDSGVPDAPDATGAAPDAGAPDGNVLTGDPLSEAELMRVTSQLASEEFAGRDEGTPGGAAARSFLIQEMQRCGIAPAVSGSYLQPITTGNGTNILGVIPGSDATLSSRYVVLSAHYDHLGVIGGQTYNGAYDNATADALVLGVACTFARNPPKRSILVAFWDAEEPRTFLTNKMGSAFYASNPVIPLAQTDVAVVLDLIGEGLWTGYQGHFVFGAELSPQTLAVVDAITPPAGLPVYRAGLHLFEETAQGHLPLSDYDAFRNKNIPILFFSDGQNRVYHTPEDDVDLVDRPKLVKEAVYLLLVTLGLTDAASFTFTSGNDYLTDTVTIGVILDDALASGGMVDVLQLSASTRTKLQGDRTKVTALHDKIAGGGTPTTAEIRSLRFAGQRVMCHAGGAYSESICNSF
ncbi:MAG: M28 family peptidase [Deltaproteobacteria bacterium]|nr:M28 family peptidase [Deltaproteobacteria bacterium]